MLNFISYGVVKEEPTEKIVYNKPFLCFTVQTNKNTSFLCLLRKHVDVLPKKGEYVYIEGMADLILNNLTMLVNLMRIIPEKEKNDVLGLSLSASASKANNLL